MTQHSEQSGHRIAFVCVQNAGRSQMAAAFAERERDRRNAGDRIEIVTGGTRPADRVHEVVVEAVAEVDVDVSDRTPREVTPDELRAVDLVVTMGCSASDVCPATWNGENRDWGLDDPHERPIEAVREIRDEIEARVVALFDELLPETPSAE
ncbi:Arsenate reductase [Halorubrum sp. DM2]|uniref:arsenate-mycothiol transferase ArsC n=1 Tax=Halorubrum sp. DM2 TaxID=2527867 RepID=UPI0024B799B5|nr:low molecular weight phosphatase family protein [Halorubrum sp. DM2]VTT85638.1 Arsenate reductase [Halorubrum sp. DM2]